jgi:hypothetical protein
VLPEVGFAAGSVDVLPAEVLPAYALAADALPADAVRVDALAAEVEPVDAVRAAWLDALAEMEAVAARSGDGEYAPDVWNSAAMTAAADLGPLPVDLQERALNLAATQKSAIARVVEARRTVMAHLAALRSVPAASDVEQSVYLDVSG